jgi:hypothetical protein
MSTDAKSSPPPGAEAILAPAAGPEAGRGKQTQPGAGNRRPRPQPARHPARVSGEDDDTDYDYYDTPSGNIWRPGAEPGQPPATNPGGRAAGPLPGREAAAGVRSAGSRRLSPSLIVRAWHHRPGRGSVCPDKETP